MPAIDRALSPKACAKRRAQLMQMVGEDAILILPAAPERIRSRDTHYPYRQDSDFWYLTGFDEPQAVLVLAPGRKHGEALMFCRERDMERDRFLSAEGAKEYGLIDQVLQHRPDESIQPS